MGPTVELKQKRLASRHLLAELFIGLSICRTTISEQETTRLSSSDSLIYRRFRLFITMHRLQSKSEHIATFRDRWRTPRSLIDELLFVVAGDSRETSLNELDIQSKVNEGESSKSYRTFYIPIRYFIYLFTNFNNKNRLLVQIPKGITYIANVHVCTGVC